MRNDILSLHGLVLDDTRLFGILGNKKVAETATFSGEVPWLPLRCPLTGLVTKMPGHNKYHGCAEW